MSGAVQGITEFLPVSSSGHLAILQGFYGWSEPAVFFDICLHLATLAAVVTYFGKDIVDILRRRDTLMIGCIAVSMVPAVIVGFLFEKKIEAAFASPKIVSALFLVTALVLFAGQWAVKFRVSRETRMSFGRAVVIGIAQSIAILPGVSRSGMTVSAGLLTGIDTEKAFRFSFLMSVPIILAAACLKALKTDLGAEIGASAESYVAGMATAFILGILSLSVFSKVMKSKKLYIFGIYCFLLGVAGILFL